LPAWAYIVTADEIPDPHNLGMQLRVNGKIRQESHTSKMSVTIPEIIAIIRPWVTPRAMCFPRAPSLGAAFSGDPKSLYLKPGDIVECEIEKIGVLRNPVVSYKELHGGKSVTA